MVPPDQQAEGGERAGRHYEHVARIRVDDTQAPNGRVAIHVEHPDNDQGVRCFWRDRTSFDVARSIRSHIRTEIDTDLTTIEVIDEAGIGLESDELLPERTTFGGPDPDDVEINEVEA